MALAIKDIKHTISSNKLAGENHSKTKGQQRPAGHDCAVHSVHTMTIQGDTQWTERSDKNALCDAFAFDCLLNATN